MARLTGQSPVSLVVLNVAEVDSEPDWLAEAEDYLETRGVTAPLVPAPGNVPTAILTTADDVVCDLIIMGGYTARPIHEVVLGSKVDQVLRESHRPILVCR